MRIAPSTARIRTRCTSWSRRTAAALRHEVRCATGAGQALAHRRAGQRQRFVEAFYQSLLQNYGAALAEFTADRLRILPFQGEAQTTGATVRSEVKRGNGTRVPVNYSMRKTHDGWKA